MIDIDRDFCHLSATARDVLRRKYDELGIPVSSLGTRPMNIVSGTGEAAPDGPRDCVKIHRALGSDAVTMLGYDEDGEVQIEVTIRRGRMSHRWERWILRWLRLWYRATKIKLLQ